MSQELLTINETAGVLRLQASTIRAWILHRRIPFVRLGRRVFVRRSDCDQLITANVVLPETGEPAVGTTATSTTGANLRRNKCRTFTEKAV